MALDGPLGTPAIDAFQRNVSDLDRVINGDVNVTARPVDGNPGKELIPYTQIVSAATAQVALATAQAGIATTQASAASSSAAAAANSANEAAAIAAGDVRWSAASRTGANLTIPNIRAMSYLSDNKIVVVSTSNEITEYSWFEEAWVAGASITPPAISIQEIRGVARISDTVIVTIENSLVGLNERVRSFELVNNSWTVGPTLAVSNQDVVSIAAIGSNSFAVAFSDDNSLSGAEIQAYTYSSSSITTLGTATSIPSSREVQISEFSNNSLVIVTETASNAGNISVISFSGSSWTIEAGVITTNVLNTTVESINQSEILHFDGDNDLVSVIRRSNNSWESPQVVMREGGVTRYAAAISGSRLARFDVSVLEMLDLSFYVGTGPYRA